MKNRVAQLVAIGKVELCEKEVLPLQNDEVLVAIRAVGICGSDRHYFLHGGLGSFKQKLPMAMGHEPAGVVVESRSTRFRPGDRVAIEPACPCSACHFCSIHRCNLCAQGTFMGANASGALSDYVVVHEKQLHRIPPEMSFEMAALLEPLGVVKHATNLCGGRRQESVTIFGCGSIGLSMLYLLKTAGTKQIFMIDRLPYRTAFAKQFGATQTFTLDEPHEKVIREQTGGRGTTWSIDTAGEEASINGCLETSSPGGTVLLIGIPEADMVPMNPHRMRTKELVLQNVRRSNRTLESCIALATRDNSLSKMITHRFSLESVQQALETVAAYQDGVIKCMIMNDKN